MGMHFANQGMLIMIATMLWAAEIGPKLDDDGNKILPSTYDWVDRGVTMYVADLFVWCSTNHYHKQCTITISLYDQGSFSRSAQGPGGSIRDNLKQSK